MLLTSEPFSPAPQVSFSALDLQLTLCAPWFFDIFRGLCMSQRQEDNTLNTVLIGQTVLNLLSPIQQFKNVICTPHTHTYTGFSLTLIPILGDTADKNE